MGVLIRKGDIVFPVHIFVYLSTHMPCFTLLDDLFTVFVFFFKVEEFLFVFPHIWCACYDGNDILHGTDEATQQEESCRQCVLKFIMTEHTQICIQGINCMYVYTALHQYLQCKISEISRWWKSHGKFKSGLP